MDRPQAVGIETVILTEIVEEGLPLDELPEIVEDKKSDAVLTVDSGETVAVDQKLESEPVGALGLDGSDDTGNLKSGFGEVVDSGVEVTSNHGSNIDSGAGENSSQLIAGDIDSLLADDDFTEIEIPENHDPVLAELKSAGLTPADGVAVASKIGAVSLVTQDLEEDGFGEEELSGIDDFLDEILIEEGVVAESLVEAGAEKEGVGKDTTVEFSESVHPEADMEMPEDYLMDEEMSAVSVAPAARSHASSSPEPELCAEPISPDFSRQIESMTQEWSKQLLQTTYASMDKMIKAIGDLAPTIVDQVAREVIPPLAEKVIKAEIARLEEKLESEEEREENE